MVAKVTESYRRLIIYVKAYFNQRAFVGSLHKCICSLNARIWNVQRLEAIPFKNLGVGGYYEYTPP